ncbi:hypothetical protein F7734_23100 [Scytonema sp. UIC 10036]|uniref:FAD-dependent oxidoreductase n=1 Tax=Scytonema sp. UIC 10036 TaxID=2304196 RepID=UPI0012DA73D0|nr:FAD-dependent oxidoreductase [Scytonema sp. UIC 10036]MUG95092.1 hypothetical protein [Scytonema sp. UIC 10036]
MPFDYDLLIIGTGSGGIAAAERAASYGVRVAIAEQAKVGGACINYGCIPEKLLDYAANYKQLDKVASSYGWDNVTRHFNWSHFVNAKNRHLQHLNQLHLHNLQNSGAEFIQGQAAFLDAHTVLVANRAITADKILIAVGAKPVLPEIPGIEFAITWRELYNLPAQPKHLAILGSDPIGVKVAGSMNQLGTHVTQIIAEEYVLPELDTEISKMIQDKTIEQGVQVFNNSYVEKIERMDDRFCLKLSGKYTKPVMVDTVFVDAPRKPNLENLNLEKVGIQLSNQKVE